MKYIGVVLVSLGLAVAANGDDWAGRAWVLESKGDAAGARELLAKAAVGTSDVSAWRAYAEFLDRHRDPAAREAYARLLALSPGAERPAVARRLAALSLLAGDTEAASKHLAEAGTRPAAFAQAASRGQVPFIEIPGPLRSFSRMAALSPDLPPEDLLPALARNVVTNGYQALSSSEGLEPTEYMKLVIRYLSQARELDKIAGAGRKIVIDTCESAGTADLLKVLGYRMRGGCGSDVVLETVNATRAFLTIDSGFPLAELEQALRTDQPFAYDYQPSRLPVLYGAEFWMAAKDKGQSGEFIDVFLGDPSLCRLYSGLSKMDPEVAKVLREGSSVTRLKAFAHVLDFYGGMFEIRNGKAVTPGGARAEKAWADLTGASPDKPAHFFERLIARDDGWLASYYDGLLRVEGPSRDYFTEPERMKRFYSALRGKITSPGPARPVFRANTDMMLLTARLRVAADGRPAIPGNIEVWRNLFIKHPHGKYDGKLTKAAQGWKEPDDVVEALFALCRKAVDNEPLKIFMAVSEVERSRAKPLDVPTVERLVNNYRVFGAQYSVLSESPALSDATILAFLDTAQAVASTRDQMLRADAAGTFQALVSMWQILVRQGSIPAAQSDAALTSLMAPFAAVRNSRDLFDAGRGGVDSLLRAANAPRDLSVQDAMLDLMAGPAQAADSESHLLVMQEMIRIFEAQRLISLQTLFELADNLERVAKGEKLNTDLVGKLASRISEVQLPRSAMSSTERNALGYGYWTEKHIDVQRKLNLRAAIDKAAADPEKLRSVRGLLAPVLRDTLVGFNYIHYAPPGAQVLHTNPIFVRSHDFLGFGNANQTWKQTEVFGSGWPSNAGGRLVGSLTGLPYALAEAEQNFLIPSREQALIWGDLVPQILISSTIPRWWKVSPAQTHWVSLHLNYGESLVAESSFDAELRSDVLSTLARSAPPARIRRIQELLEAGQVRSAVEQVMPSEMFSLAAAFAGRPETAASLAAEIRSHARQHPEELSYPAIAALFGTPKPTLSNSYRPELLNLRTFPTLMGYSSRIMAESWESNLLYYAALSDEIHARPAELNLLIPAWTQQTVEKIFATHLEDWPALLRSLRTVGEDVRQKARRQQAAAGAGDGDGGGE